MRNKLIKTILVVCVFIAGCFLFSVSAKAVDIKPNKTKLSLNLMYKKAASRKIKIAITGDDVPDRYTISTLYDDQVKISYGEWYGSKNNKIVMTVKAKMAGSDILQVRVIDDETDDIVAWYFIPVRVYSCIVKAPKTVTVKKGKPKTIKTKIVGDRPKGGYTFYNNLGTHSHIDLGKSKKGRVYVIPVKIKYRRKGTDTVVIKYSDRNFGGLIYKCKMKIKAKKPKKKKTRIVHNSRFG